MFASRQISSRDVALNSFKAKRFTPASMSFFFFADSFWPAWKNSFRFIFENSVLFATVQMSFAQSYCIACYSKPLQRVKRLCRIYTRHFERCSEIGNSPPKRKVSFQYISLTIPKRHKGPLHCAATRIWLYLLKLSVQFFNKLCIIPLTTMPNPLPNSGIRDNHHRGAFADFLRAKIQSGSRLAVVSAYLPFTPTTRFGSH